MTGRSRELLGDVHRLATRYHWSECQILALPLSRRLTYLLLIERDEDAALYGDAPADLEWEE